MGARATEFSAPESATRVSRDRISNQANGQHHLSWNFSATLPRLDRQGGGFVVPNGESTLLGALGDGCSFAYLGAVMGVRLLVWMQPGVRGLHRPGSEMDDAFLVWVRPERLGRLCCALVLSDRHAVCPFCLGGLSLKGVAGWWWERSRQEAELRIQAIHMYNGQTIRIPLKAVHPSSYLSSLSSAKPSLASCLNFLVAPINIAVVCIRHKHGTRLPLCNSRLSTRRISWNRKAVKRQFHSKLLSIPLGQLGEHERHSASR